MCILAVNIHAFLNVQAMKTKFHNSSEMKLFLIMAREGGHQFFCSSMLTNALNLLNLTSPFAE